MLGSEQIPTLVGETSPRFQLGSSHALEKLGLYIKDDEDDEEGDFVDATLFYVFFVPCKHDSFSLTSKPKVT
jgi:hypothetical protein